MLSGIKCVDATKKIVLSGVSVAIFFRVMSHFSGRREFEVPKVRATVGQLTTEKLRRGKVAL